MSTIRIHDTTLLAYYFLFKYKDMNVAEIEPISDNETNIIKEQDEIQPAFLLFNQITKNNKITGKRKDRDDDHLEEAGLAQDKKRKKGFSWSCNLI